MVATIVDNADNFIGVAIYDYSKDTYKNIAYSKVVELLKSGVCIGNLKLTKRNKLEAFPKQCGFSRYPKLDTKGKIISVNIPRVFISKHRGVNADRYALFDIDSKQCEYADANFIRSNYDKYDLFANIISLEDNDITMFSSYYNYKLHHKSLVSNAVQSLVRYKLDKFGNLTDYYSTYQNDIISSCIWVEGISDKLKGDITIDGSVYGIGYKAFDSSLIPKVVIKEGVRELEAYSFNNCVSLDAVELPSSLKKLDTNTFVNCGITTLTLYGKTLIKDGFISNCSNLHEIEILGKHIEIHKSMKSMTRNCDNLQYIMVDKDLDTESLDTLYSICTKDIKIIRK